MNKEQQDLVWACLPKETRKEIRKQYRIVSKNPQLDKYDSVYLTALENIFNRYNLTSDTEPEEMLIKSRAKVIDLYSRAENEVSFGSEDLQLWGKHCMEILDALFGDKCLPDKEPSVQVEPKFKYNIGDLVTYKGKVKKVINRELDWSGAIMYTCSLINGQSPLRFEEECIKPYTEPSNVSADETKNETKGNNGEKSGNNGEKSGNNGEKSGNNSEIPNQTKDNMGVIDDSRFGRGADKEKELNPDEDFKMGDNVYLGNELLGKFICYSYSEHYGEVMVDVLVDSGKDREANQGGWFAKDVSKTPYKPKRWRAKCGDFYYVFNHQLEIEEIIEQFDTYDENRFLAGNYFRTEELARQAAEGIREHLTNFHKTNIPTND